MSSIIQSAHGPVFAYGASGDAIAVRAPACRMEGHKDAVAMLPPAAASVPTNRRRLRRRSVIILLSTRPLYERFTAGRSAAATQLVCVPPRRRKGSFTVATVPSSIRMASTITRSDDIVS